MAKMHKKARLALRLLMEQFNDSADGQEYGPLPVGRVQESGARLPVARRLFRVVATCDVMDTATGEHAGRQARTYLVAANNRDAARNMCADAVYADPQVTEVADYEVTQLVGHVFFAGAEGGGAVNPPQPAQPVEQPVEAPLGTATVDAGAPSGPQLVTDEPAQAAGEQ